MKCVCGERLVRKGRNPGEDAVLVGRYVLLKSGSLTVACKGCGRETRITRPTVVRVKAKADADK